jgi:methylamine dehydrogenase heavy chain
MRKQLSFTLSIVALSCTAAYAQETDIEPEVLTVEESISEGDHVFVMDMGINGPSSIFILNSDDLSLEGNVGAGTFSQMMFTADHDTLFTSSVYMSRYTYGEVEAVVHEWDPETLTARREFMVNNKLAQTLSQRGVLNITADGSYLILQNATPATSVTVVDLAKGEDLAEVPTPGCWTAYPSAEGAAFSTLCGDGTIHKFTVADGTVSKAAKSEKIFDADSDPLFGDAVRVDGNLVYVSYAGSLFVVDDSGDAPALIEKIEFATDGWGPGGYKLMDYHAPSKTLFVLMHADATDGSHKLPAQEIWAIDMESKTVVGRSDSNGDSNISVSGGDDPVLFGLDHLGTVTRYDISLGDSVSLTQAVTREGVAMFPTTIGADF